jgi:hypothetical protein
VARTVGRDGTQSEPATADLKVLNASVAVFDPSIPSPICIVSALEPKLVLQHHEDDHGNTTDVVFFYRVIIDDAQHASLALDNSTFRLYDQTRPIPIDDAHCRIEAYAERLSRGGTAQLQHQRERSSIAHYSWSESLLDAAHGFGSRKASRVQSRENSVARSNSGGGGGHANHHHSSSSSSPFLKPPVMTVVCSGATLCFEDPPHKRYTIRYTLDGAQPDETTGKEFIPGGEVDVSEFLRAAGRIQVVARYFVERSGPTEPTRLGRPFSRDFSVPFFTGAGKAF